MGVSHRRGKQGVRQKLLYGTRRWQRVRRQILTPGKVCEVCEAILASAVHHKRSPFSRAGTVLDETLAYALWNLQAVCPGCHTRIHYELSQSKGGQNRCFDCGTPLRDGVCGICNPEEG